MLALKKKTTMCGEGHAAGNDRQPLGAESLSPTTTGTEFCQQAMSLEEDPEPHLTTALTDTLISACESLSTGPS